MYSISSVADDTLSYEVLVRAESGLRQLGDFVTARIPVSYEFALLPVNIFETVSGNSGTLYILEDGIPVRKRVDIGAIRGTRVELVSDLSPETRVVTTSLENYNPNTSYLEVVE